MGNLKTINDYTQLTTRIRSQCIDMERALMRQATHYCKQMDWPVPQNVSECRDIGCIIKNVLKGNYDYRTW